MSRKISANTWRRYQQLRDGGYNRARAAEKVGISYYSAIKFDKGEVATTEAGMVLNAKKIIEKIDESNVPPRSFDELPEVAQEAVYDFDLFRLRYLGRDRKPWQSHAAKLVVELEDTDEREFVVVNVPPGGGKSTTFTHDIPAWMIARGRALGKDVRIMLGSRTQRQANQYGRRLRTTLERKRPVENAEGVLALEFGEFKPLQQNLWRAEEFIIWENANEQPTDEKEPTVMCAGMDTGFLGGRFKFCIWDDLVDNSTIRTDHARQQQREWFDDEAETRLEPGGLFMLMGQRLSPDDLYRYALDKQGVDDEGVPQPDERKYKHVVYPAHDEVRCEEEHDRDAPAWPDGCLLDPVRLSWRDLQTVKTNAPRKFEIIMQQKDVDPAGTLVPRVFIDGGQWNGMELPGCLDLERSLCMLPNLRHDRLVSVLSVDPSPTKFWAVQWWIYDPNTQFRWLMDLHRAAMDAPDFLDRLNNGVFVGLAHDWVQRSFDLGWPIQHMIVERNAAQRFMLQYDHVNEWMITSGLSVVPHDTHATNKADPDFGVQTLRSQYQYGRVRLPYGDVHTRSIVDALISEVTVWPQGKTDDCVMAQWMFEWNIPNLESSRAALPRREGVPSWMSGR